MSIADVWDNQAGTMQAARRAVWADPDWKAGQRMCLAHLADMPPSGDLLDLGAGVGRLTIPVALQRPDARLWAVDVSKKMLGHLKVHARRERARNVVTRRTEGRHIPNDVPTLAGAWSILAFQHLPASQQRRYLISVADKLESGAPLIVQFVEGADPGPLSNPVDSLQMWGWMDEAGLEGDIQQGSRAWPTWRWMHAVRS
jgi:cyclopropane fatty-acyl-phospholipid synthase-like methyltransferase